MVPTRELEPVPPRTHMGLIQWLICFVAALGFAFDIYQLLVAPLVLPPALRSFGFSKPADINHWKGLLFWVPAMAGGFFGLIGGYLTDLWGRQRVLVWSILIYTISALAAGWASSVQELLVLRCITFVGVCVEFVAAVAWLAELFPNPKQREAVLGTTQAFSSLGGIMAAGAYYVAVTWGNGFPAIHGGHEAWRYTILSGVLPAIPLMIIRPFLPESPVWMEKKLAGTLHRPSFAEIFTPQFRKTTIVTAIMFACSYGAAFGAIQQLPDIVPSLPGVSNLPRVRQQQIVGAVQSVQELGGLAGRVALAVLAVIIVRRRKLLRIFQIPGLFIVPLVFFYPATNNLDLLKAGIFVAGFLTVAQFSFWGNYLPRVYPTHLRGTGESFAANVGGRMIGTSAALLATTLANVMPGTSPGMKMAYAATTVALLAYGIGFIASFWLPEPADALPE